MPSIPYNGILRTAISVGKLLPQSLWLSNLRIVTTKNVTEQLRYSS